MNLELENKVVVITGGAKGIGEAITRAFAMEGGTLVPPQRPRIHAPNGVDQRDPVA